MPTNICGRCEHVNAVDALFCARCGSSLAPTCNSCGAPLEASANFCSKCGAAVAPDPVAVADGSLKVVSVVFTDLVGSTALQEAIDAESVRRVMARFYEVMRAVVERRGGRVEKFIGDAVVAMFGAPVSREDDALRAVLCAAEMVDELERLNVDLDRDWGVRLRMRVGVNTGELVVSDEGILVGDTMNTAARFEQAAGPGEVLIGEATRRLVRHSVQLEEIARLDLKGKAAPVRAWRLVSVAPEAAASAAEAPLVGRSGELDRLRIGLSEATAARACRLVSVIGSPGLGKSRLASEFARSLEGHAAVLEGHCEQSGEGITFLPVAEVLRAAASIADDDSPERVVAKLTATVPEGPDRDRVVARVAGLLGAGAPAAPEETFWGVRAMLESLARERPLVVVVDDLHWGQPMFLDLLEHLVEWVRDAPLLLVVLARPELREVRAALASAGRRATDVIELEPLDSGESRELVDGLLGAVDLGDELLDRILETTEGNPLFLSELLRMLVDEGSLVRSGERWVAAGGTEAVQVPPTIQALLTARIERLRADERSVVERAAVIGKQFYRGAVAELVAPPVRVGIDGHLETLRRKDMVEPEGTYWIDEPVYRFHHVLIRDAAYHLLLKEARAELHEKFADWLATKAGELVGEHEEVIAYHLEQAFAYRRQLGPLDGRGRSLGARAAELLWSAGRRALAREDLAAAANLLQRARDCGADASVLWDLAEALLSAGATASANAVVAAMSGPRKVVLETQLAVLTGTGADLPGVVAATAELAAAGDGVGAAKGHHVTAQVQAQLGQVADVESSLDHALLAARETGDRRRITAVLAAAPRAALWGPSPVVRASGRCLDVVRILRMTPGNRHVEAIALRCQAVLEAMRGRADAAREILATGRTTLEELGLTLELHELAVHAGIVELLDGRAQAAEALLRPAREGFAELGAAASAAQAASLLARALVEQGRDEEAIAETELAEQRSAGRDLKTTITWLGVRAEALARRGALDDAVAFAQRAVALAEPTDALADKADAYMALARVLAASGDAEKARRAAERARELYAAKDHAVGVAKSESLSSSEHGKSHSPPSRAERAIDGERQGEPPSRNASPGLGNRPLELWAARRVEAWNRRDREALAAMCHPDIELVDHRKLGWDTVSGASAHADLVASSWEHVSADQRLSVEEVLACDEHVIAMLVSYRGTAAEGGGEVEFSLGQVWTVTGGRMIHQDIYDPDDREAIMTRYAELGGRRAQALGDRPPERWLACWIERYVSHERDGLRELWAHDCTFVDHREMAWEELRGAEALLAVTESTWEVVPDNRCEVDEVLACDENVIAVTCTFRGTAADGGGPTEIAFGWVEVIEDGVCTRVEQFAYDDRKAMLARYVELGGGQRKLGDSGPEQWWRQVLCAYARADLDGLVALYAEQWIYLDHRELGWEGMRGQRDVREFWRSALDLSSEQYGEIDEVIARDARVIAIRLTWRGAAKDGGGQFSLPVGNVSVIEDGRAVSTEQYGPDETDAILARYTELSDARSSPCGERPIELLASEHLRRFNTHDAVYWAELVADDFAFRDHRTISLGDVDGREVIAEYMRSLLSTVPDVHVEIDEVLACDQEVIAVQARYRGSNSGEGFGAAEVVNCEVWLMQAGKFIRSDLYDADDRQGMIARYAELGGGLSKLGDTQPERWWREYARHYAAHDRDAVVAMHADGAIVDHRKLGWESVSTVDEAMAIIDGAWAATSDIRIDVDEVLATDERACALRIAWRGTEAAHGGVWEIPMGAVTVIEDGRSTRFEMFDPDDRDAILAKYEELRARVRMRAPEVAVRRYFERYSAHDIEGTLACYTEDIVMRDHRQLALWDDVAGQAQMRAQLESVFASPEARDVRMEMLEVVACDDRVIADIFRLVGTNGVGGGEFEVAFGGVARVTDGLIESVDLYDVGDRHAMIARYAELGGGGGLLGDRAPERFVASWIQAFASRHLARVSEMLDEDGVFRDRRALGWEEVKGRAPWLELVESGWSMAPDLRIEVDEVIACDERVIALRDRYVGSASEGGGTMEIAVGYIHVVLDGRMTLCEQFEYDDIEGMLARYAALGGGLSRLGDRPPEQVVAELERSQARHDLDALLGLFSPEVAFADHRRLAWEKANGVEEIRHFFASAFEMFPVYWVEVDEVLACDDRVIAMRTTTRGRDAAGAGRFEISFGAVLVCEQGRVVSWDQYGAPDREAMLARFAELTADAGRDLMTDRVWKRYLRAYNDHDVKNAAACLAAGWTLTDHRATGMWDDVQGREAWAQQLQTVWNSADGHDTRLDLHEVIAQDDRIGAWVVRFSGTDRRGGPYEVLMGWVMTFADEQTSSIDMYDPEDRWAMTARYAELGGGLSLLGDRPPERVYAEFLRRWAAGDLEQILELCAEDYAHVDHRPIGWETVESRDGLRQFAASAISATCGFHCNVDEVLARDERILAMRATWRGHSTETAGELEFKFGYVAITEHGLVVRQEFFDYDDVAGMLARHAELTAPASRLPEVVRRSDEAFSRHDRDALGATYAPDIVWLDRRGIGGENYTGRDAVVVLAALTWENMSPDIGGATDALLASDDRVFARVQGYRGAAQDGGGELELLIGQVIEVEAGLIARIEFFDPDDRPGMLARYAELGGGLGALGSTLSERLFARYAERYAARDLGGLLDLVSEDWVLIDHRAVGWEELRVEEYAAQMQGVWETVSVIWIEVDEVLAAADRVLAAVYTYRGFAAAEGGGGQFEYQVGYVGVNDDRQSVTGEFFDPADRSAMLGRYAELTSQAGPEPVLRRYLRAIEQRDVDGLRAMVNPEIAIADHRWIAGPPGRGPDAAMELVSSALGVTSELRFEIEDIIAQDDHAIACSGTWVGRAAEGEGEVTLPMALLMSVKDERVAALELYEPDDAEAMRARFEELSLAALKPYHRFDRLYNERRLDALPTIYTEDYVMVDRRSMAWEEIRGAQALVETCQSFLDSAPDLRSVCVVLEEDRSGELVLLRNTFTGRGYTAGGGATGPVELVFIEVSVQRDDRISRTELFDPSDERVARARFEELRVERAATLGDGAGEAVTSSIARYMRAYQDRDWEELAQLWAPDAVLEDHRPAGLGVIHGVEGIVQAIRGLVELASDARTHAREFLELRDSAALYRHEVSGHDANGGAITLEMLIAAKVEDGRLVRAEMFALGDESTARARFAAL